MNDSDPKESIGFWESKFRDLVLTSADKADRRARNSKDPYCIIENMETKRILMQYGTDLLHLVHGLPLDEYGRERLFEAVSHNMLGTFLAGRLGVQSSAEDPLLASSLDTESKIAKLKTGPAPIKKDSITAKILQALRSGENLASEKQEVLTARFGDGASRGTVKAAFDQAMSMLASENSDGTLTDDDKQ